MARRVFLTSSAMNDAVSQPPKANVNVDQKIRSLKCVLGISAPALNEVADPKRLKAIKPITRMMTTGSHMASPPTLLSHLLRYSVIHYIILIEVNVMK